MHKRSWMAVAAVMALAACPRPQTVASPDDTGTNVPAETQATYRAALNKAENPTPADVYPQLTAITPDNKTLQWKTIDGHPHVLVSSWVSTFDYYKASLGKTYNTGAHRIWVTAAPHLQELCTDPAWRGDDVNARLERFLGMPPATRKEGFASFWVKPADLFRPCPDPEITDTMCALAFPDDVTPAHRAWFNHLRAHQYQVSRDPESQGWPWTQLGYTFDWQHLDRPIGISEFIIDSNATVHVDALTRTADYCGVNNQ